MRTAVHGMGRIGPKRELKWALEAYWAGRSPAGELEATAAGIRRHNWETLSAAGINFMPSNDFSLYDHVLDAAVAVSAVPRRFARLAGDGDNRGDAGQVDPAGYFAMARGGEVDGAAVAPLELTKWFDTNYHQLVPEIAPETTFASDATKAAGEMVEAAHLGISTTPVLLGPLTFLLRSAHAAGTDPLSLLDPLADAYADLLAELEDAGASWVRLDEPALVEDRTTDELAALRRAYRRLGESPRRPKVTVSTYFGHAGDAMGVLCDLPVEGVGLDFCRGQENLALLEEAGGLGARALFAGVVDGRNVWANDLDASLDLLDRVGDLCGEVVASSSCSFLHVPASLVPETTLDPDIRPWLAFAEEKLAELSALAKGAEQGRAAVADALEANRAALAARRSSPKVTDPAVRRATSAAPADPRRSAPLGARADAQRARLGLPPLPTTSIGSFPQTPELRAVRASWRAGRTGGEDYRAALCAEIDRVVALQEELGLDVVVHGEPERDDMVRYFAAQLGGFVLPETGWVQSYGSRCVRPPILYGDVSRPTPITLEWARYAQSRTTKPVKGMLTGPVTMLCWSFVRDDQPEADTAAQLGLAIGDELTDLQAAGTAIIQVDEPALREGMPLRVAERLGYLAWATRAFRLATQAAAVATQVHTHMCYAELADVVDVLEDLEVDVVSFEASRSHLALLGDLRHVRYRGGVGPGVYDVHSPLVPAAAELETLLRRALGDVGADRLWVNPDCGLKTRRYDEVTAALAHMVAAARTLRAELDGSLPTTVPASTGPSVPAQSGSE
jgi:5-methyltetrahydropteroyltriglutamate--homocysteine methyltransferase